MTLLMNKIYFTSLFAIYDLISNIKITKYILFYCFISSSADCTELRPFSLKYMLTPGTSGHGIQMTFKRREPL
jgi:hypothetical protein